MMGTGEVNLKGPGLIQRWIFGKRLDMGQIVALEPEEYVIMYSCDETGSLGNRRQGVFISVRDPMISKSRLEEILKIADEKITMKQRNELE